MIIVNAEPYFVIDYVNEERTAGFTFAYYYGDKTTKTDSGTTEYEDWVSYINIDIRTFGSWEMIGSSMPLDLSTLEKLYRLCRIIAKKRPTPERFFILFYASTKLNILVMSATSSETRLNSLLPRSIKPWSSSLPQSMANALPISVITLWLSLRMAR